MTMLQDFELFVKPAFTHRRNLSILKADSVLLFS